MRASRTPLAAVALLVFAACGARVSVGFVGEGDSQPPPFAADAARPEASPRFPGCADKGCGDLCTPCEDDASTCPAASVFHVCSVEGECLPAQPRCTVLQELDGAPAPEIYVPCAGLACAAACTSCDPVTSQCPSPVSGVCHADGACGAFPADCR